MSTLNILTIGDVTGTVGCNFLMKHLPSLKRLKKIDVCIANGENSAQGNGITPVSAQMLFSAGVDLITTGNHAFNKNEAYDMLDERMDIIRPANYNSAVPGRGTAIVDLGRTQVGVLNLSGNSFMNVNLENAFECVDRELEKLSDCTVRLVDFHAEATSEKRAMGLYLDGRVSAVFGTHTHVLTADEQILPEGTGYITDIGMTGPIQSVLGVKKEAVLKKMQTGLPVRFEIPDLPCMLNGCIFEIDTSTGKAVAVERVCVS